MNHFRCLSHHLLATLVLTLALQAQVPNTLLHSIPPPPAGVQDGAGLGSSVAVEGDYAVAGAPYDDTGGINSGVVKVFHSGTGALLFVLPNPSPTADDYFGISVAISGTRVVVGASQDNTGATYAGSAYVYDLTSATPTVPTITLNNPSPAAGDYFGTSVAISGARVVVGAYQDDTGATDAGSVYFYDLTSATPTVPTATLNNPSPDESDRFGTSVAISGTRVVVGAYFDDTGATDAGSAYVYDFTSATPTVPVATLNNPSPAVNEDFGNSVAISGTHVVVGARSKYTGAFYAGSAYVYDLTSATPTIPTATLTNPSPAADDNFGFSVAISGTSVVVGAYGKDITGTFDAGSAYVYDLSSATPTVPTAAINNPGPAAYEYFGISVAISGTRVIVGAVYDNTGARVTGNAYVYDLTSATPTVPTATLNHPGPAQGDNFGNSVASSGTLVVVGAYNEDTGASNAGSAYVYDLSSATPTVPTFTLHNPSPAEDDYFGYSVAISGTRVVVGAYSDDTGASDVGSAYVYDLTSATPTIPTFTLNNPSPEEGDLFGLSVSISVTRVVVGAYLDDSGAANAGSAYVYDLTRSTPTVPIATLNNPSPEGFDYFGWSVAISGTRVVVGASRDDTGASDAGSAYVYDLTSGTPAIPTTTLKNPNPAARDYFGWSVAISGTRVVVGAFEDDSGGPDVGSAYVYDLTRAAPTVPVATLNNPSPTPYDHFGYSVAISGTTIVIGTPNDDTLMPDKGYAYIYGPSDADGDGLLDTWERTYWPTTTGHGPLDDFDHDGYVEVLELALGLNPTVPDPGGLPPVTNEGGYLTMTITKHAGVTYEVQSAGNLSTFSPATTTILLNNATTLKVRDNTRIGTTSKRFLRVKVTTAP